MNITLTVDEIALVFYVAASRQVDSMRRGSRNRHGATAASVTEQMGKHIEGAGGECAFARAIGRFWAGDVNAGKAPDVAGVQVRTRSDDGWDLIVRSDDADGDAFVLVTGVLPAYRVVGWIRGGDAKQPEFLANHGGWGDAWFVPQVALREMP